jgi:two-component system sensor histidine kinase EvgS
MGGLQAAKEIRAHERALGTGPVRLVAYSGSDSPEDMEAGRMAGFDRYLFKPARVEEIRSLLRLPPKTPRSARPFPEELLPLAQLAEGDLSVMREAVNLFLLRLPDLRDALDAAESRGDLEVTARVAHRLKGSVSLLGDRDVLMLSLDLLGRARGGDATGSWNLLPPLRTSLDRLAARLSDQAFWDDLAGRILPK